MSSLYTFTIYPLEIIYNVLYKFFVDLTGSFGVGLLCLSLVSSILFIPLKRITASLQAKEEAVQKIMQQQLDVIKAQSFGAERQTRIRKLYRRYAYNPLMALRSSFGILMQIPFLCAAYYMIIGYTPLQGQQWWFIKNLGMPDGILCGINFLPLFMTLCNLGAVFTVPVFSRKNRIQGVFVAGIFLLILYHAPSALLVYWTGNNVMMLLENIIPKLFRRTTKNYFHDNPKLRYLTDRSTPFNASPINRLSLREYLKFSLTACGFFIYVFCSSILPSEYAVFFNLQNNGTSIAKFYEFLPAAVSYGMFLIAASVTAVRIHNSLTLVRIKSTKYILVACIFCIISVLISYLYYYGNGEVYKSILNIFYVSLNVSFCMLLLLYFDITAFFHALQKYLTVNEEFPLYVSSILLTCIIVFIFSPISLFESSPHFFSLSLQDILWAILPYLLIFVITTFIIWILTPKVVRPYITFIVLTFSIIALLNSTIITGNYGSMDGLILSNGKDLKKIETLYYDLIVFIIAFLLLTAMYCFRQTKKLVIFIQASFIIICINSIITLLIHDERQKPSAGNIDYANYNLFTFSKEKTNVVIFFLDMFTGGHIPEILSKEPDLEKRLSGFTWFPDTVSIGSMTGFSAPSIFGGPEFVPDKMNNDPSRTLNEKFTQALGVLPRNFGALGYLLSFVNPLYELDREVFKKYSDSSTMEFLDRDNFSLLISKWSHIISAQEYINSYPNDNYTGLMLSIALFRAVPHILKATVYNNGQWRFGSNDNIFHSTFKNTLYECALLSLLPSTINTNAASPTFKVFYSMLPHYPWHLPENGLTPMLDPYPETIGQLTLVDGIIPEHFYAEAHIMKMLADFFDELRAKNIFDNTMIILVSDHCETDSRMLNTALGFAPKGKQTIFGDRATTLLPVRPHALLMVKPIRCNDPFRISDALMSTSDVPALVCEVIGGCPGITSPNTGQDRERVHFYGARWRQIEEKGKKLYDTFQKVTIRGTMFKKENWTEQEQQ